MCPVIPLSKQGQPLFRQVYSGLRQAILSGALRTGERLPSTRDLAEQLGISRTVVLLAYDQLLAEGFVAGRSGSGTYVAENLSRSTRKRTAKSVHVPLSRFGLMAEKAVRVVEFPSKRLAPLRYDFAYGRTDTDIFPFAAWRRILMRRAREASAREFDYAPATGSPVLREAICAHLRRSRAVVCDPEDVIVTNGSQQALDLIARVLVERGDSVAVEDPQYPGIKQVLLAAGARLSRVAVDEGGLNPANLPEKPRLVFVTPSHQFPTGAIMPLVRRVALLQWAREKNAVIVEDDYDGEFHYEGRPLESLQGLDTEGRVLYVGTFSRTMFPALRIGYLIVPKSLTTAFTSAKWISDLHSATLEQESLAEFISSGMYERHLRQLRRRNAARREVLLEAVDEHLRNRVDLTGDGAGAHVILWPRNSISEYAGLAQAAGKNVRIYGIAHFYLYPAPRVGFMLGYSRMSEKEIREGIRLLADVF